jgi:anthranilate phosphoribosyltransferase
MVPKMSNALARLGTNRSWVVHGGDGLDEISLSGSTLVGEVIAGSVTSFEVSPADFSLPYRPVEADRAHTPAQSAELIRSILSGNERETQPERLVLMNAAAAIYVAGRAESLADGYGMAKVSVHEGHAMKSLQQLAEAVRQ